MQVLQVATATKQGQARLEGERLERQRVIEFERECQEQECSVRFKVEHQALQTAKLEQERRRLKKLGVVDVERLRGLLLSLCGQKYRYNLPYTYCAFRFNGLEKLLYEKLTPEVFITPKSEDTMVCEQGD